MKKIAWAAAAVMVAGVALSGCSAEPAVKLVPGKLSKVGDRVEAGDLAGEGLDGKRISLADFRGKVVALNAWSSWCGPCRLEAPGLEKVQKELGPEGFQVVGINSGDDLSAARAFDEGYGLSYPTLMDPGAKQTLKLPRGASGTGIPFTVFIDRQGRVASVVRGPISEEMTRSLTGPLLKEPA